jgi:hypothetical protein
MFIDPSQCKSALRQEGHVRDESSVFVPEGRHVPPNQGRPSSNLASINMTLLTEGGAGQRESQFNHTHFRMLFIATSLTDF